MNLQVHRTLWSINPLPYLLGLPLRSDRVDVIVRSFGFMGALKSENKEGKIRQDIETPAKSATRATQEKGKEAEALVRFRPRNQFLVRQFLRPQEILNGFREDLFLLTSPIEPIGKFIAVASEMLYRNLVECSVDSLFQKRESVLNRIGMVFANPVGAAVIDRAVSASKATIADYCVDRRFVGLERRIGTHVLFNHRFNYRHLRIVYRNQAQFTAAFNHAYHNIAVRILNAGMSLAWLLGSKKGLVHFHQTLKQSSLLHGLPDTMIQKPSGTVIDSKMPLHLVRAHSLFRFSHHGDCHKPRVNWQVRLMENCASGCRELVQAFRLKALVNTARGCTLFSAMLGTRQRLSARTRVKIQAFDFCATAFDAAHAVRPARLFQIVKAGSFGCELLHYVYGFHGALQ